MRGCGLQSSVATAEKKVPHYCQINTEGQERLLTFIQAELNNYTFYFSYLLHPWYQVLDASKNFDTNP